MDLHLLEHFLRIAEAGSINRAAKELGLSQPALSRSISRLERDLGHQLVVRCRTGITITEAGLVLASRAEALLREASAIREELTADPAGRVVVGMPSALRHLVTLPAIGALRSASPGTVIRVYEGLNVFLRDLLKQGVLDVAIIAVEQVPDAEFVPKTYVNEPFVLVRNANLPATSDPARFDEIIKYPLVLPGRPNIVRKVADRAFRERGLNAKIIVESENLELCFDLVREGIVAQTITIGSALVKRDVRGLRIAPIENGGIQWAVAVHHQRQHTVPVRRMASIVAATLRDAIASGSWPRASQ